LTGEQGGGDVPVSGGAQDKSAELRGHEGRQ
jgi:hypothetical protein